jgi:hypothetical protein
MSMIEVDLTTSSEGTVSSAAVDATFWATYSAQATAYAAQYGYAPITANEAPDPGSVERNVNDWSDWTTWVQTTASTSDYAVQARNPEAGASTGSTTTPVTPAPTTGTSGPSTALVVGAVAAVVIGVGAIVVYAIKRKAT